VAESGIFVVMRTLPRFRPAAFPLPVEVALNTRTFGLTPFPRDMSVEGVVVVCGVLTPLEVL
jgi:hypothetical protein